MTVPTKKKGAAARFVTTTVEVEGRIETKIVEVPAFEPAPWGEDFNAAIVGTRAARVDALEKVTGRARYTVDTRRGGMMHAAVLRAPMARGTLVQLDLAPALAMPGVRAALGRNTIPRIKLPGGDLFAPEIRYAGQPVAALCADAPHLARLAAERIVTRYETTPHAVTIEDALAPGAPRVTPRGNLHAPADIIKRGDAERALATADVRIAAEYRTPTALHSALEPHAAIAEWEGGRLTVWESTQGIFNTRDDLAAAFELPKTHVRVLQDYMGGGFGAKNGASTNAYIAALLSRAAGRPVRCVNDRAAEQTDAGNRPATIQRVRLGARRDGTLVAITLDAECGIGAGGWDGGPARIFQELYACPNVHTRERFVMSNAGNMASFRAPGHVEGAFALERAMDELARALGMDPLALRLKNLSVKNPMNGASYSAKHLAECYRDGAKRFGWAKRVRIANGRLRRGHGSSEARRRRRDRRGC